MLRQFVMPIITAALLATAPAAAQESAASYTPKSGATAVRISLLATAVPIALGMATADNGSAGGWLAFYGLYFGPSTGYFYVGRPGRVIGGGMLRVGISVATVVGVLASCGSDWLWSCGNADAANAVALLGLGAYAASAAHDIVSVRRAVGQWNEQHEPPRVSVTPRINPVQRAGGVTVRVTF